MNLQDFQFPIVERPVAVNNGIHDLTDCENRHTYLSGDYKAIVRRDTTRLISIVRNSYDMSERVRMFWGAIRGICINGMVFG
ncbi:MAG: hypothetical protein GWN00_06015 [Aliifodinibius sp.]|nr:hypothetical protein [Fodinibius sp.]NIV10768.1 hypothetical protein [Fodinibius sp.]NIY24374.1 hypothetical protein [Fodinibius sp.]